MFNAIKDYLVNSEYITRWVTHVCHLYYSAKERLADCKINASPVWIIEANEFCIGGDIFDITETVNNKMKRDTWVDWDSLKESDTIFIEIVMNIFGKQKRIIINENFGMNTLYNTGDVVYAYLECDGKTVDISELLAEYINIPVDKISLGFLEYNLEIDTDEVKSIEMVVSKFSDLDEITIKLK